MFSRLALIIGWLFLGLSVGQATNNRSPITMAEDAYESNTNAAWFPASDMGTMLFKGCDACNQKPLQLDATSRYYLRGQEVSFDAFKIAYNSQGGQFTVYFKPETHLVTRIKLKTAGVISKTR
jgi:hypothetical protein